ncbi:SH3-domain-containing protein [Mycena chlorophos]|uniref:SH3-domain-containing protein n=1 Tax=Mycena chlorophos TaxID=658473 RepID=A0A8H6S5S0_MYCCL|nr:SH3-domain-containing protein [Mycena chlorophos]
MATTASAPAAVPTTTSSPYNLMRYAIAKSPDVDPFHGSSSRDFCNSFWGEGDEGVNVLFVRLRGAARTTDDLRKFWQERAAIEEEYASRLCELAKVQLGKDEIGDLRNAFDTLLLETARQGTAHLQLASQIRTDVESPTTDLLKKQISHRKRFHSPLEKRFVDKQAGQRVLAEARNKHIEDRRRLATYTQQLQSAPTPTTPHFPGKPFDHLTPRPSGPGLKRAELAVQVAEKALSELTRAMLEGDGGPQWERDWKEFCDLSQDLEEDRIEVTKDVIWGYANAVSTLCVGDDQACERVRTALDQLEPELEVLSFVQDFGTGNLIPGLDAPGLYKPREAQYARISTRPAPQYYGSSESSPSKKETFARPKTKQKENVPVIKTPIPTREIPPPQPQRLSGPLPRPPPASTSAPAPAPIAPIPPVPDPPEDKRSEQILFYVEALYAYQGTAPEEFDFQPGDVIAVTAAPEDGWWSGELLDERRRRPGQNIFPSNYVKLF